MGNPEQSSGGWETQSKSADVTVTQGTNHPAQVDTIVSEKGSSEHYHVATDKQTGETIWEGWRSNTPKKK